MTDSYPDSPDFGKDLDTFLRGIQDGQIVAPFVPETAQDDAELAQTTQQLLLEAVNSRLVLPGVLRGFYLGRPVPDIDALALDDNMSFEDHKLLDPFIELTFAAFFGPLGTPEEPHVMAHDCRDGAVALVLELPEDICSESQKQTYLAFINRYLADYLPPRIFENEDSVQLFLTTYEMSRMENSETNKRREELARDFGQRLVAEFGQHEAIADLSRVIHEAGAAALGRILRKPELSLSEQVVESAVKELAEFGVPLLNSSSLRKLGVSSKRFFELAFTLAQQYSEEGVSID